MPLDIEEFNKRKATVAQFESKYLEEGTEIIHEAREDEEESKMVVSDPSKSENGSIDNPFQFKNQFSGRDRANTKFS